jgi:hypothetical protein
VGVYVCMRVGESAAVCVYVGARVCVCVCVCASVRARMTVYDQQHVTHL